MQSDTAAFLSTAIEAARAAGTLLRENFGTPLDVAEMKAHDIKLDLDVRAQDLITKIILDRFPDHAIYGEEGIAGNQAGAFQWIVDPIDGTVNYFYSIPHFCVSIALRENGEIILGVIYDPMRDELWQTQKGSPTLLNGRPCSVSARTELSEATLSVGFSKTAATINAGLVMFGKYVTRARKLRMMGSAALDMAFVASGRLDAYIEQMVSLWDIAAGKLLVENAGGTVIVTERTDMKDKLAITASSGRIDLNI